MANAYNGSNGSVSFPYATMEEAEKDNFKKLETSDRTGKQELFRLAVNGYKQNFWRKGSNERRQEEIKELKRREKEINEKYAKLHPESAQATRR